MSRPRPVLAAERHRDDGRFSSASVAVAIFAFLTIISAMAGYYSKGDEAIVAFVVTSYLSLVLLLCCLWFYKNAEPESPLRNRLQASVWNLTSLLTFSFAYKLGKAGLNLHLALLVWFIAAATGIGAFFVFFEQASTAGPGAEDIPLLCNNGKFFWAHVVALFGVITVNSVMAGYCYRSDGAIVALVATSSGGLVLLFYFIWLYNKSAAASSRRNRLKALVSALNILLTFSFCYAVMVMAGFTLPLALLVWTIAGATGIGAFSTFFENAS